MGKEQKNKHLTSDILNLPNDLLSAFLDGYFENDGCIIGNLRKASTVSKELALGIQACVHKVERKLCTIYHSVPPEFCTIESRVVHQSEVYDIRYPVINKKETKWFYKDNYIWTHVKSKTIINTDVEVYNFEVEGDNSYVANNIAVHNCQDISVAGKMKGIKNGTRSGIFYDIIKLIKGKNPKDRPKWLVIENVKNLLSIDGGRGFAEVLGEMAEAGYDAEWQVCNSKDFGVPQNRERVYIVGYIRTKGRRKILPIERNDKQTYFKNSVDEDNINNVIDLIDNKIKHIGDVPLNGNDILKRVYDPSGISPTLTTMTGGNRQPKIIEDKKIRVKSANSRVYDEAKINDSVNLAYPNSTTRRGRVGKQVSQTLQCTSNMGVLSEDYRIRKLTPLECWRLQGFPDELFEKASKVNCNSQLYKQAGNSVTVNVTNVIAEKIGEMFEE